MRETWVQSLGWEDPLEKGKATHSSILTWRILRTIPWGHKESDTTKWLSLTYLLEALLKYSTNISTPILCQACSEHQIFYSEQGMQLDCLHNQQGPTQKGNLGPFIQTPRWKQQSIKPSVGPFQAQGPMQPCRSHHEAGSGHSCWHSGSLPHNRQSVKATAFFLFLSPSLSSFPYSYISPGRVDFTLKPPTAVPLTSFLGWLPLMVRLLLPFCLWN